MAGGDKVKVYRTEHVKKTYSDDHPMDVVISFDTTISMSRFLLEVREQIARTMRKVFSNIKNVRVAVSFYKFRFLSIVAG